ncbi:uncharacterized LOC100280825 [Zea mays]|uniref:SWIb domain-containing protein n=1 Tax=Zea mays TaxID=4577 RepID=B6SMR8_MAIZE|eukprot:NP_001147217.1 uncharacterized protein LOC100280825 [Zea mays]
MSHISFLRVCSYIKDNKLQDPTNNNILKCDEKLKTILLGRSKATPSELPMIVHCLAVADCFPPLVPASQQNFNLWISFFT